MGLHVSSQIGSVRKRLFANRAVVRLLPCMRPLVPLKEPRAGESLATNVTLVVEVVCENMHGQSGHGDIHLSTDMALFGIV